MINLLAISGSLRAASYNTAVVQALISLAPDDTAIQQASIAELPLFNPDLENDKIDSVVLLKSLVRAAEGLIIASPEYAHGISGPMKNALDWLVSGVEFADMPVLLVNTSPRASHGQQALREVLRTMSGQVVDQACFTLPLLGTQLASDSICQNKEMVRVMTDALVSFKAAILASPNRN